MKINIKSDGGANTTITTEDGKALPCCVAADISIRPEQIVEAQLRFVLPAIDLKGCEATVSEAHLRELAAAHGFDLVRR